MMNVKGCSVCPSGQENYQEFYNHIARKKLVQYDYRTPSGMLFSTVKSTLEDCRASRVKWEAVNA